MSKLSVAWIDKATNKDNIVVSSRIRIARNLADFPFPTKINKEDSLILKDTIYKIFADDKAMVSYNFQEMNALEKQNLVDKRFISPQFLKINNITTGLLINKRGSLSIMVNEEDHLRIQSINAGLRLSECFDEAKALDSFLEDKVTYAYDSQLGYLTSCITNIGTGIRASVMLHLPALSITGNISQSLNSIAKLGFVSRGIYGEGSNTSGNMFQISNQITLGRSEQEIIANLKNITIKLVEQEKNARNYIRDEYELTVEDQVGRSLGILKYCYKISSEEAMKLLSDIRLGIQLELVNKVDVSLINSLIYQIQGASLQSKLAEKLNSNQRDIMRAEILRENLKGVECNDR